MCISSEINLWLYIESADFTLRNSLFGTVKLTKKSYADKYSYSGSGTGFDACKSFSLYDGRGHL